MKCFNASHKKNANRTIYYIEMLRRCTYCINLSHPGFQTWLFLRWHPPGWRSQAPHKRDPLPPHCWPFVLSPGATSLRKDTTDYVCCDKWIYPIYPKIITFESTPTTMLGPLSDKIVEESSRIGTFSKTTSLHSSIIVYL